MTTSAQSGSVAAGNADQSVAWNGPEGAAWADHSSRRPGDDDLAGPLLDAARVGLGDRVLDVGCGTGDLTRRAAAAAPAGAALGIDLSATMIDRARRAAAEARLENVRHLVGDAQTHRFGPDAFDRILSHFGTMFFADPVAAFTNLSAALRPGGRLLFVCPQSMDRCDWYRVPLRALSGRDPRPADAPSVMFSLADRQVVTRILVAAGLTDVRLTPVVRSLWFGFTPAQAARAYLESGPVRALLERTPTLRAGAAQRALEAAVTPYAGPDGVRIPGAHWLVEAARPAATP